MASGRQQYTDREDAHLVKFLAEYNPTGVDRRGNKLWKDTLCGNLDKFPWAKTHPWQSWRDHYKKSDIWFDRKIKKMIRKKRRDEAELPPEDDTEPDAEPRAASPKKRRRKSGRDSDDEVEDMQQTTTKQPQKKRKVDESTGAATAVKSNTTTLVRVSSNDANGASSAQESPRPRPVTPPRQPVTPQRQPRVPRRQAATPPPEPVTPRPRTTTSKPQPADPTTPRPKPATLPPREQSATPPLRQQPRRAVRDKQPRASSSKVLVEDMRSESEVDEGSVYEDDWVDGEGYEAEVNGYEGEYEHGDEGGGGDGVLYDDEEEAAPRQHLAAEGDYAAEDEEEYAEEDEAALLLATEDLMDGQHAHAQDTDVLDAHEARDMPASDDYGMVSEYIAMEVPPVDEEELYEHAPEYGDEAQTYEEEGAQAYEENAQAYGESAQAYGYEHARAYEEAPAYEPQTPDQIDEDQENRIPEPEPSSIPHGVPGYSPITSSTPSSPSPPERIYPDLRQLPSPNLQRQITAALRKHASVPTLRSTPLRASASLPAPRRKPSTPAPRRQPSPPRTPSPPRAPSPPRTPPRQKLPPLPPLPSLRSVPADIRKPTPTESSPQTAVPVPQIQRTSPPTERPSPPPERGAPLREQRALLPEQRAPLPEQRALLMERSRTVAQRLALRTRPSVAPTPMPDPPSEPPGDTEWPAPETEMPVRETEFPAESEFHAESELHAENEFHADDIDSPPRPFPAALGYADEADSPPRPMPAALQKKYAAVPVRRKKPKKDIFDDTSSVAGTPVPRGGTAVSKSGQAAPLQVTRTAPPQAMRPARSALQGAQSDMRVPQPALQAPRVVGLIDPLSPHTPPAQRSTYGEPSHAPPIDQATPRPPSPHTPTAQRSGLVAPPGAAAAQPVAHERTPATPRSAMSDSPPPRQPRKLQEGAFGGTRFVLRQGEEGKESGETKRWPPMRRKRRRSDTEEEDVHAQTQAQPAAGANVPVASRVQPQVVPYRVAEAKREAKRPRRTFIAPRDTPKEEARAPVDRRSTLQPVEASAIANDGQARTKSKLSASSRIVDDVFTEADTSRRASDTASTTQKAPAEESISAPAPMLSRVPSIARTASFHSPIAPPRKSNVVEATIRPIAGMNAGTSRRHTIATGTPSGLLDLRRFAITRKGSNSALRHSRASSVASRTSIAPSDAVSARAPSEVTTARAPSLSASFLADIDTSQDRKMLEDLGAEVAVKRLSATWGFAEHEVRDIFEQYERSLSTTERCLSVMREGARRAAEEWQEALERSLNGSDAGSSASKRADSAVQAGEPSVMELSRSFAPQDASTPQGQQPRPAGQLQISPPSAPRVVEEREYSPPAHTRSAKYARLQREGRTEEARAREARRASGQHSRPSFAPQENVQVKEDPGKTWSEADERLLRSACVENVEEVRALTARTDMGLLLEKVQAFAGDMCAAARQKQARNKGKGKAM
ncbi:uncharacterized protein SCHCODRAFT_02604149 [Schizophyllum commune H4-8]|uniref:TERF2-interacting telomeric protein 1 Myb domain-containing protein n=1 Tax=Schizophyllum commune (strain H4-8 / FGSC 9210) TaxID=578458 RepID=D8PUA2_SCHCM|nr:uncharacterized protein SCHCODRAFT_02604149 [Schizophyllum commune H4-8]KAI5899091.1 hypothetical protein SCHCODRAFT_02604149 [Schizophyllum commune H4-8]